MFLQCQHHAVGNDGKQHGVFERSYQLLRRHNVFLFAITFKQTSGTTIINKQTKTNTFRGP
jgi:hypothetical protein